MNAVVDRVVQYPHRYQLKNVNTGEVLGTFDLEPITGTISVVGTKIDKELFDSIAKDIANRLVSNGGDAKDNVITYTMASNRSNIVSGEKLSVSFGKIAKYFNDLKAVAFSGSKADIGLGNVDNTSDADKPVSNATQQALNLKANSSDVYTKTETDGLLNNKANKSDVYTKSESDTGLNKSLYNLGYYDTMVENADGSYTITRQTGYLKLDEVEWWKPDISGTSYTYNIFRTDYTNLNIKIKDNAIKWNIICNKYQTLPLRDSIKDVFNTDKAIGGRRDGGNYLEISDSDYNDIDSFKASLHNVYLQYELATSYTEKVEANHYARYNERFILEHNKSEAERSANLLDVPNKTDTSAGVTFTISNGVINVNGSSAESAYPMCEINSVYLQAGTYTLSKSIDNSGLFLWVGSNLATHNIVDTNGIGATFTITTNMIVYISIVSTQLQTYSNFKFSLMLNKGSIALPYQPYEGKVVHEKELGEKLGDYLPLTGGVIDAKNMRTPLILKGGVGNYREGLRIIPTATWATILLGGSDVQEDGGTSNNSWVIANNDGNLYISKNRTDSAIKLSNTGGTWKVNDNKTLIHEGNIGSYLKTINGNSIVGSGDLPITPGIFSLVGNNVDTLTISKNETYFIVSVAVNPIYVEGNTGISFIGSSLVTTVGMLSGEPKICLNGSAYTLDNNSVTLKTTGLMKVYKVNY